MNTDPTAIFRFAGPVYTCACCHAHWGGYEGNPNITRLCGTCSGPKISESRYVNTLRPPPEREAEIKEAARKKFGGPHDPALDTSYMKPGPGASTSFQRLTMLPFLSIGDATVIMADIDPPKPWWKRLFRWWWYGDSQR